MARIKVIEHGEAEDRLKEIYDDIVQKRGRLAGYIENNQWVEFFILVVLLSAGISFFLRRNKGSDKKMFILPAF